MKDGLYRFTDDQYFQIPALSNSYLKRFDRSPEHAYTGIRETSRMKLGKFMHAFLLSPYEFKKLILAPPEFKNRKNIPYPEFEKLHHGKEDKIILDHEFKALKIIKEKLLNHEIKPSVYFGDFYNHKNCEKEIATFYCDPEIISSAPYDSNDPDSIMKFCYKGKLDLFYYDKDLSLIFDPKLTNNSKDLGFQITKRNLKYYRQEAFYKYLIKKILNVDSLFYFIGIEDKPPYGIDFHDISKELSDTGLIETFLSVQKFINWVKNGSKLKSSWEVVNTVLRPAWMKF